MATLTQGHPPKLLRSMNSSNASVAGDLRSALLRSSASSRPRRPNDLRPNKRLLPPPLQLPPSTSSPSPTHGPDLILSNRLELGTPSTSTLLLLTPDSPSLVPRPPPPPDRHPFLGSQGPSLPASPPPFLDRLLVASPQ
ncbi:hypothetical protein NL676_002158 [Syzygium grande]|nr:hypothetical protein NL676_002158 [Syzygium grande]